MTDFSLPTSWRVRFQQQSHENDLKPPPWERSKCKKYSWVASAPSGPAEISPNKSGHLSVVFQSIRTPRMETGTSTRTHCRWITHTPHHMYTRYPSHSYSRVIQFQRPSPDLDLYNETAAKSTLALMMPLTDYKARVRSLTLSATISRKYKNAQDSEGRAP